MIPISSPSISDDEVSIAIQILRSGALAQGKFVQEFEDKFSEIVGGAHCIAVNSGTSALHLSLLALGISSGDEVIVPAFTFAATANAVVLTGGKPVFIDVCSKTFNLDVSKLESLITDKTKAIIPVHLYGQTSNMTAIMEIASRFGLQVLEDASQAHLASHNGQAVGTFGSAAAFSFYATKNMTTGGEGGLIVTKSDEVARKVKLLRNQGMKTRYQNEIVGFNLRMTELQAGIGLMQLEKLKEWTQIRRRNAQHLDSELQHLDTPHVEDSNFHVYHQYTIKVPASIRTELIKYLNSLEIGTAIYYPTPIDSLPAFRSEKSLPVTQELTKTVLSIPVHPKVSEEQTQFIADSINKFFGN